MAANFLEVLVGLAAALEVLDLALMLFGLGARLEGAEVAAFAGFRIDLARIEAVFAGFQFADHGPWATSSPRCSFHPQQFPSNLARLLPLAWKHS